MPSSSLSLVELHVKQSTLSKETFLVCALSQAALDVMQNILGGMWAPDARSRRPKQLQKSTVAQRIALQILPMQPACCQKVIGMHVNLRLSLPTRFSLPGECNRCCDLIHHCALCPVHLCAGC